MMCFGNCANKFETTLKEQIEKMLPMIEERVTKIVEEQLKKYKLPVQDLAEVVVKIES